MTNLLFRNRYRIPSSRLLGWDYGRGGAYCVTICTQNRECYFGEIQEGRMDLSLLGQIVAEEWEKTPKVRTYVTLDSWVVMPNHIHGILLIDPPRLDGRPRPLGEIIGQFKGVCTRRIWAGGSRDFDWQPRFFDQIIPDEQTLLRFRKYILENPLYWGKDRHHPDRNQS